MPLKALHKVDELGSFDYAAYFGSDGEGRKKSESGDPPPKFGKRRYIIDTKFTEVDCLVCFFFFFFVFCCTQVHFVFKIILSI